MTLYIRIQDHCFKLDSSVSKCFVQLSAEPSPMVSVREALLGCIPGLSTGSFCDGLRKPTFRTAHQGPTHQGCEE